MAREVKLQLCPIMGCVVAALGCTPSVPPSISHPLAGHEAPVLTMRALDGRSMEVPGGYHTRATVVDFWASWCESCPASMRALEGLWQRYRDDGLRVVGVSADEDEASARAAAERIDVSFPIVLDDFQQVLGRYRVARIPLSFVLDGAGTVRWVGRNTEALEQAVRAVLAEPERPRDLW